MNCFSATIENAIKATILKFGNNTIPETWLRTSLNNVDYRHMDATQYFPQVLIQASNKYQESEGATLAVDIQLDCATYFEDDVTCSQLNALMASVEKVLDRFYWGNDSDDAQAFFASLVCADFPNFCFGGLTPNQSGYVTIQDGAQVFPYAATIHFTLRRA